MNRTVVFYIIIGVVASILELFVFAFLFPRPSYLSSLPPLAFWLFIILTLGDSAAFGLGVTIVVWTLRNGKRWGNSVRTPFLLLVIVALWFAMLGWVHDGLHLITLTYAEVVSGQLGWTTAKALAIDLTFHDTTIILAALILVSLLQLRKVRDTGPVTSRAKITTLIIVAVVVAISAYLLSPMVFPANGLPDPPDWIAPLENLMNVWDAVAFGLGVSFLIWTIMSWRRWRSAFGTPALLLLSVANYAAIQPWVHNGLHFVIDNHLSHEIVSLQFGSAVYSLLGIMFLFHFPWLIYASITFAGLTKLTRVSTIARTIER